MVQPQLVIKNGDAGRSYSYETESGNTFNAEYAWMGWSEYPTFIHAYNGDGEWNTSGDDERQHLWFDSADIADAHIRATFQRITEGGKQ